MDQDLCTISKQLSEPYVWRTLLVKPRGKSNYYSAIVWFVIRPTIEPWGDPCIPSLLFKPSTTAMDV